MKELILNLFQKYGLRWALMLILVLVVINTAFVVYFRGGINEYAEISNKIQLVKDRLSDMDTNIRLADIGVRAFIIKQEDRFLDPYHGAKDNYQSNLDSLAKNLTAIGFDIQKMTTARKAINEYMQTVQLMVDLCKEGKVQEAIEIFYQDKGLTAWQQYSPFVAEANNYVVQLETDGQRKYRNSINSILIFQLLFLLFVIPVLIMVYRKLVRDGHFRAGIFKLIDSSNRKYLFDDGKELDIKQEDEITNRMINNLEKTASYIHQLGQGDYSVAWEGVDEKMLTLNKDSIVGALMAMREFMQKNKQADDIRIWNNEGLSKFAELIRKYQDDIHNLSDILIAQIVEYMNAQQGKLFFLSEDEQHDKYLELMGCYAYKRKKFVEQKVSPGQGLVGQCFLEGETTHVTNIPSDYTTITSGLGDTKPRALLIIPLKVNDEVLGVIELASLKPFDQFQIDFLEKLSEAIASAIATVKNNEQTRILLEQSQQQAEEMRAQEEEMRQNMEELQATQEQMHRKNEEVEQLLKQASENEESMKLQMEALEELQQEAVQNTEKVKQEADDFKNMLMDILNELPQKIFLKDAQGKMYIANQKVADVHGLPLHELIGKSDYDFVDKETADEWRKQELEILKKGEEKYVVEDHIGGEKRLLETIKKAFHIKPLGQQGLLGIQTDITQFATPEKPEKSMKKS